MAQGFQGIEHSYEQRGEAGHHRRENRQVFAVSLPEIGQLYQSEQWAGLKTLVMVIRVRNLGNKVIPFFKKYVILGKGIVCVVKRQ